MASLMTIYKQVEREGARWGLHPEIRDGKVKVCQRVATLPSRPNSPKIVQYVSEVIASLDENSPMNAWTMVLMKRLTRFSGDIFKKSMTMKAKEKEKAEAEIIARRKSFRDFIRRSSNRVISVGGHNPDGSLWTPR